MPNLEMITLKELLRDPQYREYFRKVPKLPSHYTPEMLPWKLLVLKRGELIWRSKRFGSYGDAFAGLKKMLPTIDNAAINCPALGFMPPTRTVRIRGKYDKKGKQVIRTTLWIPQISSDMEPHNWCPHCRRPTIFKIAALAAKQRQGFAVPASEPALRCSICGTSERVIDLRHPENAQKWDINRPKVTQ